MGSGARAQVSQTCSRETLDQPPRALRRAGLVPCPLPAPQGETGVKGQRGPKDLKNTAVERRWALTGLASRCGSRRSRHTKFAPCGAPLPLFGEWRSEDGLRPFVGEQIEGKSWVLRQSDCRENAETWLFDNLTSKKGASPAHGGPARARLPRSARRSIVRPGW